MYSSVNSFCVLLLEAASDTNFESVVPRDKSAIHHEAACNKIATEAVKRGSSDNVSVMIIEIKH